MSDGVELAATLYLPDSSDPPQPCLLEALPYRKDDLTSSYAASYERLRDKHGYAVCRLDLRGTGSSGGDALDEYQPDEQRDLAEVMRWLAAQDWCDGQIGMWGTSYSGFNSLQMACEQPPELKAICAIYATDDRWTDDVHWRGGALRLVDLVDYDHYMTPMNVLPPVPAVWGDGWEEEWKRRLDTNEPWVLTWLRESTARRLLGPRVGAARRDDLGLRADPDPDDDRGGLGRRLPQQHLPHRGAARRPGDAPPAARRPVGARRRDHRDARAAHRLRRRAGRLVRPLAARRRGRTRTAATSSCAPRPDPSRTSTCTRGTGCDCRRCRRRRPDLVALRGAARAARHRRRRHRRLDRLRRPPAVGALRRPAARRRPVADLGRRPAGRSGRRLPRRAAARLGRRSRRVALGQAVRRLPRRHLGPGLPRLPRPGLPVVRARRAGSRWCPARRTTSRWSSTPAPTSGRPARCCASASRAPTGPTPSRRRPR